MNKPDIMAAIGDQLRALHGYSIVDVETLTGGSITAARLGSYERGYRCPTVWGLYELGRLYDIDPSSLLPTPAAEDQGAGQ